MSDILAERGLLDDSQAQTSGVPAETFHGEKSTNFHGEKSVGPAAPLEGQYLPAKEGVTLLDTDMVDPESVAPGIRYL